MSMRPAPSTRALAGVASVSRGRATGRQAWALLWRSSRPLAIAVLTWATLDAVMPPLVVGALGVVVGEIPPAITHGLASAAGTRLIVALVIAAAIYAFSLLLDPVGGALSTTASARITGALQQRLLRAVSGPVGVAHLEDADVLDRLGRVSGSLTGFFPGDAPVTWVGMLAGRLSGVLGCVVVTVYVWWLGLALFVMWFVVRRIVVTAVIRQATELRGQATSMRRAWYYISVGSRARDAKEVRVFGLGEFFAGRFRDDYLTSIRAGRAGLRRLHARAGGAWLIVFAAMAAALTVIADDVHDGSIGIRTLAIVLPMIAVTMSVGAISFDDITLAWTMSAIPDLDRLEADLIRPTQPTGDPLERGLDPGGRPQTSLRFDAVHFRYPAAPADVLTGLDLELTAGTSTAIVGVNGAGKSTLVSLISRLRDPSAGAIFADGIDISTFDAGRWQRLVAVMPQEPARYPTSAYENVAFGAIEHADDRPGVEAAAGLAGFADVVESLPDGWSTILSRELPGGVELSGGQWQRLALARALFATRHGARLLILDEPTAALDARGEAAFYARFLEITHGLTTVVISHRFATVRRADTICVLDGGRITERGSHDELLAGAGTYARMYRLQAARFAARGASGAR
jgi:ATP-binding cassette, subfamily B, bacterial